MSHASDYLENRLVDWLLRGQNFAPPASVHVALFTAAPSDSGGGTEVSGGGYARVAVSCSLTAWAGTQGAGTTTASSGTSGQTSNNATITFPTATASWGTVTHIGIFDAPTGGNLLFHAPLSASRTVDAGDVLEITAGQLKITFA